MIIVKDLSIAITIVFLTLVLLVLIEVLAKTIITLIKGDDK